MSRLEYQNTASQPFVSQDYELGQRFMNEVKIHELDKQLVSCWMLLYYFWILLYALFTVPFAGVDVEFFDEGKTQKKKIIVYSVIIKVVVDIVTALACLMVFVGLCRKSIGIINKIVWIFWINLIYVIAFYLLMVIVSDPSFLIMMVLSAAIAYLNILPVVFMKKILEKRDVIYPYSSLVDSLN